MKYEPNTRSQPYSTLGEQVDYYAEQGKVMVVHVPSYSKSKCVVIHDPKGRQVIWLNSSLGRVDSAKSSWKVYPQSDILGFISLADEVDP